MAAFGRRSDLGATVMAGVVAPTRGSEFATLCREIRASGLLDRRYRYYAVRASILIITLVAVGAGVVAVGNSWWQALVAVALAVVLTQIAFFGHDAGHQQICRGREANTAIGLIA